MGAHLRLGAWLKPRSDRRNAAREREVRLRMDAHPIAELFARLPEGWSAVRYRGRRWGASHTRQADGRVEKVYAEELGGTGVVSANLYLPGGTAGASREQLRPCEMPAADVLDFLRNWEPLPDPRGPDSAGAL